MSHRRFTSESGFTIIELLVVVIILGLLAAIAIPNLLFQQAKAHDVSAKSSARTAQMAMEQYEMEHHDYTNATPADLADIDPSLNDAQNLTVDSAIGNAYKLHTATNSTPQAIFWIERDANGATTRSCSQPGEGGCGDDGSW